MAKPFTIKNVTFKNRFGVSAMVVNMCSKDGMATEQWIRYHEEKARGGFGLIITEDYAVCEAGKGFANLAGLWNDSQIPSHAELTRRVHNLGAKIFAQIYHAGRQTSSAITGHEVEAPSAVACNVMPEIPRELSREDIHAIVEMFGDTALRAKKAGFDGVEVHGAHGYLIAEFLSPFANKRVDEYGGCLANRLRFPLEIIANIRKKVGDDFIIQFKLSCHEPINGGNKIADTKAIAMALEAAGVDSIDASHGSYDDSGSITPPYLAPHAVFADLAAELRKVVDIPIMTVGRINDPLVAEQIIADGRADMALFARGSLCDPALPNKALAGEFDSIRHCLACMQCGVYLNRQMPVRCALNPLLSLEYKDPLAKTEKPLKIAVIGGGPAGMETAILAATKGHKVTLFEKSGKLGGQLLVASVPSIKSEISTFTAWQISELKRRNVEVHLNTAIKPDSAVLNDFDAIIVAVGSTPVIPSVPGIDNPKVVTAHDILAGKVNSGKKVLVIGGGQIGIETAYFLSTQNRDVTVVEMMPDVLLKEFKGSVRAGLLNMIGSCKNVTIICDTRLDAIDDTGAALSGAFNGHLDADTIVMAVGVKNDSHLYDELLAQGKNVYKVGDARTVGQIVTATHSALDLVSQL